MNYIFTNGRLVTCETPGAMLNSSLLVARGRIAAIGSLDDCKHGSPEPFELIDLRGNLLLPAFTDTHTHFTEYAKNRAQIDLAGCSSVAGIRQRLETYRRTNPELPRWILGGGWDKNSLDEPQALNHKLLDEFFPHTPTALYSKDYHSRWCNTAALKAAGISSASPDPAGGRIHMDSAGHPTGILVETASEHLEKFIVPLSDEQTLRCLEQAAREIHKLGLVSVHSMEVPAGARVLEEFCSQSRLLRVCRHFYLEEFATLRDSGLRTGSGDHWYRLGGLKLFADGSLGSQTGAIFGEYPQSAGNRGILRHSGEEIHALAKQAAEHGFTCLVHAIGDRAVFTVIQALLRLQRSGLKAPSPFRIEHVQAIRPEDIPLLKECGAYCALQPVHLANDVDMIEAHWRQIRHEAYSFRSILSAGIPVGFGSDAPIETINPFAGIYSAVERRKNLDPREPAWLPEQRISVPEALHAYTLGAARVSGAESWSGSLTPGKVADLIVLKDFTALPPEYWLEASSLLTMLDGQIVFRDQI
jgi:predicted amidohydrolase YtcJ